MYLNIVQLAESFGVAESVVESWIRDERLPAVQDRGRWLFDRGQVVAWAAQRGLGAHAGFLAAGQPAAVEGRRLERWLRAGGIWRDVAAAELPAVLERVVAALPGATASARQVLVQRVRAPGGITWAPVGGGLALPHLRSPVALGRESGIVALLFLRDAPPVGVETGPDGDPIRRMVFFIAPSPRAHLELLARLSSALTRGGLRELVNAGAPDDAIFAAMAAADRPAPGKEGAA